MSQNVPAQNAAQYAETMRQLAAVPPHIREAIANSAIESQRSVLPFPYFSAVQIRAAVTGADPARVYTINPTPVVAFNYQIGQALDGAGFLPGTVATKAETNILAASQTRNNAEVVIWGLALEYGPRSDVQLLKLLLQSCNVDMSLNGQNTNQLGRLSRFPASGGMFGEAVSKLASPPIPNSFDTPQGAVTSGNPQAGNYYKLPQPIFWNSIGGGKKDSSLSITITPQRTLIFDQAAPDRPAIAQAAGIAGQPAWTSPVAGPSQGLQSGEGTFVDLIWHLICVEISQRSDSI
jgi:hypothetical protein